MQRGKILVILLTILISNLFADQTVVLNHDNMSRYFDIHVPPSYDGITKVPLVIDIHGYGGSRNSQKNMSGFETKSDQEGFILVRPEGYESSWNAGLACCGEAVRDSIDDVDFILQIIEFMKLGYEIDTSRIYATGHSNGSAMSQRLAAEASDIFAAVAGFALMLIVPPGQPKPTAVINFHGYDDRIIYYDGGIFQNNAAYPSAPDNFETWAQLNKCIGSPVETTLVGTNICETYLSCEEGVEVTLCSIESDHMVYNNNSGIDLTAMAWDFLSRFTLNGKDSNARNHLQNGTIKNNKIFCTWDNRNKKLVFNSLSQNRVFEIFNSVGKMVATHTMNNFSIQISNIPMGTYFIKDEFNTINMRFVNY